MPADQELCWEKKLLATTTSFCQLASESTAYRWLRLGWFCACLALAGEPDSHQKMHGGQKMYFRHLWDLEMLLQGITEC